MDPLDSFRQLRDSMRTSEDLATQTLERQRNTPALAREFVALLASQPTPPPQEALDLVLNMVEARARQTTAAEMVFAAAVDSREAIDKLIRLLEEAGD